MCIPPVIFVSYRTPILILPCCSVCSATSKPPTRPDLMFSDTIRIARLLSAPLIPFQLESVIWFPTSLMRFSSVIDPLRSTWAKPLHSSVPYKFLPFASWRSGFYRPSVAPSNLTICHVKFSSCLQHLKQSYLLTYHQK